jgi:hypothetical protein
MEIKSLPIDIEHQNAACRAGEECASLETGSVYAYGYITGCVNEALRICDTYTNEKDIIETVYATLKRAQAFQIGYDIAKRGGENI